MNWAHLRMHGISTADYRVEFGNEFLASEQLRAKLSQQLSRVAVRDWPAYSRDDIVRAIRKLAQKHAPSSAISPREGPWLLRQAVHLFGNWRNALVVAGVSDRFRPYRRWSRRAVREHIQSRARQGLSLAAGHLTKEDAGLKLAAINLFGDWPSAVKSAGFHYVPLIKHRTLAQLAQEVRAWCREHGPLCNKALRTTDMKLCAALYARFGPLKEAARQLGVPHVRLRRQWSRQIILRELKKRAKGGQDLRPARIRKRNAPFYHTAGRLFGSMAAAYEAAGLGRAPWRKGVARGKGRRARAKTSRQ